MADNVAITAGAGTTIATDDIAGVQYQRVKLSLGADGAATDVALGSAVSASSMPVVIASDQASVATKRGGLTTITADITGAAAAAYIAGDCYGTVMTLTGAASGTGRHTILRNVRFTDYDDVMGAFDLYLFDATITVTDNGAWAPADNVSMLAALRFPGGDDVGGSRFYELQGLGVYLKTNADANLYAVCVLRTGCTIATTTAINHRFFFTFEQV